MKEEVIRARYSALYCVIKVTRRFGEVLITRLANVKRGQDVDTQNLARDSEGLMTLITSPTSGCGIEVVRFSAVSIG